MHEPRPTIDVPVQVDVIDLCLMTRLHGGLPLSERPFADVAAELGLDEDGVIGRLQRLLAQGVLSRFGPLYQIERSGGLFVLAAIAVPPDRYASVTEQVNAHAEVAHNYRREHALNMWFVVAAESPAAADAVLALIGQETGLEVHAFPKEREYHVELRLPLLDGIRPGEGPGSKPGTGPGPRPGDAAAAAALAARTAHLKPSGA